MSHLAGVALNGVPLWVLMTGWIGKGLHAWGKQRQGGEEGKKKTGREIPIQNYYRIHFLDRGMNIRFHVPGSTDHPLKEEKSM